MTDPAAISEVMRNAVFIHEAGKPARDRGVLSIWTVFDHPADHDGFIARRFEAGAGMPEAVATADTVTGTLDAIRESMTMCGLYRLPRDPSDPPKIVESWL